MKKIYLLAAAFLMCTTAVLASCSEDDPRTEVNPPAGGSGEEGNNGTAGEGNNGSNGSNEGEQGGNENEGNESEDTPSENTVSIRVGGRTFTATLEDNETAKTFKASLPMTVTMNELNGNEKYYYLSGRLPVDSYRPGTIQAGDLMLYGSNCLVLFYETFSSSYSYTRIGKIDNPAGLAEAVGSGNVSVTFE